MYYVVGVCISPEGEFGPEVTSTRDPVSLKDAVNALAFWSARKGATWESGVVDAPLLGAPGATFRVWIKAAQAADSV